MSWVPGFVRAYSLTHTHLCVSVYPRTYAPPHTRTSPRTHTITDICIPTYIRTHTHTYVPTYTHLCVSEYPRTYVPTHARTYTRIHPRTHIRVPVTPSIFVFESDGPPPCRDTEPCPVKWRDTEFSVDVLPAWLLWTGYVHRLRLTSLRTFHDSCHGPWTLHELVRLDGNINIVTG